MDWTRTTNKQAVTRKLLEGDAVRMMWEINYRLLMESGLTEQVLQVEQISVSEFLQPKPAETPAGGGAAEKAAGGFGRRLKRWFGRLKCRILKGLGVHADHGGSL